MSFKETPEDDMRWKMTFGLLEACVPPEQRENVQQQIQDESDLVWMRVGLAALKRITENTFTLAIAWTIHTLLI
ncbi:MAG TPA: hypothetical protein VEX68_23060 [Bryobacteraceae bacterium]|nr:hypothetical protein [Bryobacteraceae bacterium]